MMEHIFAVSGNMRHGAAVNLSPDILELLREIGCDIGYRNGIMIMSAIKWDTETFT